MLLHTDIFHKDTLSLHELLCYAGQDILLMLLYTDIVHKDVLFLHEVLFCADEDLSLILLDTDIVNKDIWFFHEWFYWLWKLSMHCLARAKRDKKDLAVNRP